MKRTLCKAEDDGGPKDVSALLAALSSFGIMPFARFVPYCAACGPLERVENESGVPWTVDALALEAKGLGKLEREGDDYVLRY